MRCQYQNIVYVLKSEHLNSSGEDALRVDAQPRCMHRPKSLHKTLNFRVQKSSGTVYNWRSARQPPIRSSVHPEPPRISFGTSLFGRHFYSNLECLFVLISVYLLAQTSQRRARPDCVWNDETCHWPFNFCRAAKCSQDARNPHDGSMQLKPRSSQRRAE